MESVEFDAAVSVRGWRTIVVEHSSTDLTRGLEPREVLIARTDSGEYHVARVRIVSFGLPDTIYTLDVGARIPAEFALERDKLHLPDESYLSVRQVIDLRRGEGFQPLAAEPADQRVPDHPLEDAP